MAFLERRTANVFVYLQSWLWVFLIISIVEHCTDNLFVYLQSWFFGRFNY